MEAPNPIYGLMNNNTNTMNNNPNHFNNQSNPNALNPTTTFNSPLNPNTFNNNNFFRNNFNTMNNMNNMNQTTFMNNNINNNNQLNYNMNTMNNMSNLNPMTQNNLNNNNTMNTTMNMTNNNNMMNNNMLNNTLPMNNMMMNNTTMFNNKYNPFFMNSTMNMNNMNNPLLNTNGFNFMNNPMPLLNSTQFMPMFPLGMNTQPFPIINPNLNLNPSMNQNFNNFNFIGFNGFNNNNNNNLNNPIHNSNDSLYLNPNSLDSDIDENFAKLKKQFVKELDEYQYKNKDKFENAIIEEECSICLCKYKITDNLKLLPCRHCFHKKCIKKWLSSDEHNKCPLCNLDIKAEINKKKSELEKHIYEAEHENDEE